MDEFNFTRSLRETCIKTKCKKTHLRRPPPLHLQFLKVSRTYIVAHCIVRIMLAGGYKA